MITYAGIGSRKTPQDILLVMDKIARYNQSLGFKLYSGGADGADKAFANNVTNKTVFLPWNGFNGQDGIVISHPDAMRLAETLHPAWHLLSQGARNMMARNCHQILGESLNDPVNFVVCWTPDGSEGITSRETGGTGQAIRLAHKYEIPICNMQRADWKIRLRQIVDSL